MGSTRDVMNNPRLRWAAVMAFAGSLLGCGELRSRMRAENRLAPVVSGLRSPDEATRQAAMEDLAGLARKGLAEQEALFALREAAEPFPKMKFAWQEGGAALVSAAAETPRASYVPVIAKQFGRYSAIAQAEAMRLLAAIPSRKATETLVRAFEVCGDTTEPGELSGLMESPRDAAVLFPASLRYLSRPKLQWPLLQMTLAFLKAGEVRAPRLQQEVAEAVGLIHDGLQQRVLAEQAAGGEMWFWKDDAYRETRSLAGLVTDVLGHLTTPGAGRYLSEALAYRDPRLKLFAALGILRRGGAVAASDLDAIAANAECRNLLFDGLKELGKDDVFPSKFRTQAAFAESDLVNWLVFPTELDRAPDEIELMAVVPGSSAEGPTSYYLFRFRTFEPHWAAKDGWMAGVSGPFLMKDSPTTDGKGETFSSFEPWNSKTPEEHIAGVTQALDKSRATWMKGK